MNPIVLGARFGGTCINKTPNETIDGLVGFITKIVKLVKPAVDLKPKQGEFRFPIEC